MYNSAALLPILQSILGDGRKQSSNQEYYFFCPFCHHHKPKLAVNLSKGKWQCWKCHASGNKLYTLFKRLDVSREQLNQLKNILGNEISEFRITHQEISSSKLTLPEEYIPLWKISNSAYRKNALFYLQTRNITAKDIVRYQIGYCEEGRYKNRIIVPSFDENNQLNFFVGRDFFNTSYLPYLTPPVSKNIIGFENFINWKYPVILCEGVFDAIAIRWNAIPLFGKYMSKKLITKIIEKNVSEIYVALDKDALQDTIHIIQTFMREGRTVHHIQLDTKDPSLVGFKGMFDKIKTTPTTSFKDMLELKLA